MLKFFQLHFKTSFKRPTTTRVSQFSTKPVAYTKTGHAPMGCEIELGIDKDRQLLHWNENETDPAILFLRKKEQDLLTQSLNQHGVVSVRSVIMSSPSTLVNLMQSFGTVLPVSQEEEKNKADHLVQLYVSQGRGHGQTMTNTAHRSSDEWHSDNSYNQHPASVTALYALELPTAGPIPTTLLCDTQAAYAALPLKLQRQTMALSARHQSGNGSQNDGCSHPVVRKHSVTGQPSLFVNPSYTTSCHPNPSEAVDFSELLEPMFGHMLQGGEFVAEYEWRFAGDLLIWDNARMLHKAMTSVIEQGNQRKMLRCSVQGEKPEQYQFEEVAQLEQEPNITTTATPNTTSRRQKQQLRRQQQDPGTSTVPPDLSKHDDLADNAQETVPIDLWKTLTEHLHGPATSKDMQRCFRNSSHFDTDQSQTSDMLKWMVHGTLFLQDDLQMPHDQIIRAMHRHPDVLFADAYGNNLVESYGILWKLYTHNNGMNGDMDAMHTNELLDILSSRPQLLCDAMQLDAAVQCLQSLGNRTGTKQLFIKNPPILERNVEQLKSTIQFFKHLGMEDSVLQHVLFEYPLVWTYDIETQLSPLAVWLETELQVNPAGAKCKELWAWPNAEKVLSKSMKLLLECGYTREEMCETPIALSYSYDIRIEPRARYVKMLTLIKEISTLPTLKELTTTTDEKFCDLHSVKVEHYKRWVNERKCL
jgi:alpha-ketoglutarate-dependent taurine dioxygenase